MLRDVSVAVRPPEGIRRRRGRDPVRRRALLVGLVLFGMAGTPGHWLPLTAQERLVQAGWVVRAPRSAHGEAPGISSHLFDEPVEDVYSWEASNRAIYNIAVTRSGAAMRVIDGPEIGAPGANDVLAVIGQRNGASAEFRPRRVADGNDIVQIRGFMGLLTDDGVPQTNGWRRGVTNGSVEIINANDRGQRLFVGMALAGTGQLLIYSGTRKDGRDSFFTKQPLLPAAGGVEFDVRKGRAIFKGRPRQFMQVQVRKPGAAGWTRLHRSMVPIAGNPPPPPDPLEVSVGAFELGPGGQMFFDDIMTSGLNGAAEQPIIDDLAESAFDDFEVLNELLEPEFDSQRALNHLADGIESRIDTRKEIRAGDFQGSTRVPKVLRATQQSVNFDRQAIGALRNGDTGSAIEKIVQSIEKLAEAGLAMRGHKPRAVNPLEDPEDPKFLDLKALQATAPELEIFTDGFESGDVSAWSRSP